MITRTTALELAALHLRDVEAPNGPCVILDAETIVKPYGCVFFYQSKEFLETGDFSHQLAGNGPTVVDREDGFIVAYARPQLFSRVATLAS